MDCCIINVAIDRSDDSTSNKVVHISTFSTLSEKKQKIKENIYYLIINQFHFVKN